MAIASKPTEDENTPATIRPTSPPPRNSFANRGIIVPAFSSFHPRNFHKSKQEVKGITVAWTCDGRRLASASGERVVRLWDVDRSTDNSDISLSGGHAELVNHIACHPHHPQLLCSSTRKSSQVFFWDARQKRESQTFQISADTLQYAPDGQSILALDTQDHLRIFDFRMINPDEPSQWSLSDKSLRLGKDGGNDGVYQAIFNHAGDQVFVARVDGGLNVLEYPSLNVWHSLGAHVISCYAVALDPRGSWLASGGADGLINFFDTTEWIAEKTVATIDSGVRFLAFSFDGEYLAASAADRDYIDIIATETGETLHRIPSLGPASSLAWHPFKHLLASGGDNEYCASSRWLSLFGP